MKKFFKKVHLWLSVPVGILLTIICLTGAVLVFRTEIEETVNKDIIFTTEQQGEKLSLTELLPIVSAQLEDDQVTGITIPADPTRNYIVSVASNMRTGVYVNPYTGEVLGKMKGSFFSKMLQLHRWLLIKRDIGKPIVGYTTLLTVIILISGLIIIFPKNRKQLKRIFSIKVTAGWKRFWYDLHVSGGMWVLIGLLVLALTGLTWSFKWYRDPFYKLFGAAAPQGYAPQQPATQQVATQQKNSERSAGNERQGNRERQGDAEREGGRERQGRDNKAWEGDESAQGRSTENRQNSQRRETQTSERAQPQRTQEAVNSVHWDELLIHIQKENPNYKRINIRNNSVTVTQNQKFGNSRASDRYTFDGNTGQITEYLPYKDQEHSTKVRGWIYSIHVGSWGGWFSKIITCLVSLIGASLPVTGYYLWIKRLRRKHSQASPKEEI